MRFRKIIIILLFGILTFQYTAAFSMERLTWQKYRTKHMTLYFSSNFDSRVIPYLIKQAQRSEEFIKTLYGWEPQHNIAVVFDRETDMANGWSQSFIKDKIHLFIYPPQELSSLGNYKNYELNLLVHEYTHSSQTGMTSGIPKYINYIFGNLFYPGALLPVWLIEGAAVYSESNIDNTGRLHFPLYRTYLNSFFSKGNPFSIDQLSGSYENWLGGENEYLYGTFFYDYMVRTCGAQSLSLYFKEASDNVIPYIVEREAPDIFGKSFGESFEDFITKYKAELFARSEKFDGFSGAGERFDNIFADISQGGRYIFYGSGTGKKGIYEYDGRELNKIFRPPDTDTFSMDAGKLLITIVDSHKERMSYGDIYLFDRDKKDITRLTTGQSASNPIFYGSDAFIYFSYLGAVNRITAARFDGTVIFSKELLSFDTIYSPSISPDSKTLVFSGNIKGREKNIFLMDIVSGAIKEIFLPENQYSPSFINNDEILFSSDSGEKIAPLTLNLKTLKIRQLITPQFVALYPKIIGSRLFFTGFDNDGYFPAWSHITETDKGMLKAENIKKVDDDPASDGEKYTLENARFYEGLFPSLIMPDLSGGLYGQKLGFKIFGQGNTDERSYELYLAKGFGTSNNYEANINYNDEAILPGFRWNAFFSNTENTFKNRYGDSARGGTTYFQTSFSFAKRFSHLFFLTRDYSAKTSSSLSLSFGFRLKEEAIKTKNDDPTVFPFKENPEKWLSAGIAYGINFSFSPGSYYLFSEMDSSSLSLPVTFSKSAINQDKSIAFHPSFRYSLLLNDSGKMGFITRHSFYSLFLRDGMYSIGGDEKDRELLTLDTFMYGGGTNITVRGYDKNAKVGKFVYFTNNEFRFHVHSINRGIGLLPVMFKNIQGDIFCDFGSATGDINLFKGSYIASVGIEAKLLTYWWYRVPLMFSIGLAKGLTEKGTLNLYFFLGNSF